MGKWINNFVTHPYHRILLSSEKEPAIDTYGNMDGSQRNYSECKKESQKISDGMIQFI